MTYEMRKLNATDIFPMLNIISKIGLKNIKELIEDGTIESVVGSASKENYNLEKVGLSFFLSLGDIVCANIMKCQNEIFDFFASLCQVEAEELKRLELEEFVTLIVHFVQKEELGDFLKVVSKFLS